MNKREYCKDKIKYYDSAILNVHNDLKRCQNAFIKINEKADIKSYDIDWHKNKTKDLIKYIDELEFEKSLYEKELKFIKIEFSIYKENNK